MLTIQVNVCPSTNPCHETFRNVFSFTFVQDTPIPGHYQIRDFIEEAELNPVWKTYGFKGVGRKSHILGVQKGDLLLPGAYDHTDSTQEVLKHQASYSFKNCPRPDIITLGIRDKVGFRHDL